MNKEFLPHLQGLRAVAVIAVVCFHAFPSMLPGGFIGVDIFFVISGYLISGIIYRGLAAGTFRFSDFYVRRVRRIFPALLLVMGSCLLLGYVALLPAELDQLGVHTLGGAGFMSNFLQWREAGYFDNSAASKPLLHLWSLGVEEQFYIAWPVIVFLAWRRRRVFAALTIALALASFAYNLSQVHANPLAAFYSPLSRFWEIAVGSLLALYHIERAPHTQASARHAGRLALAGALLLAAGCFFINAGQAYPGAWALIPVAATALLLDAGPAAPINRSLLSQPILLWLGSISYPLYLWHWPLYSFAYIAQSGKPGLATRLLAVAASVLLAHLTYVWLEKGIRLAPRPRLVAMVLAGLMAALGGSGYAMHAHAGFPQRHTADLGKLLPSAGNARPTQPAAQDSYPAVHMAPDSPQTQAYLSTMRQRLQADSQFINKIWSEKNRLQRYASCHIYDEPGKTMGFDDYLLASAGCTGLAPDRKNILVVGDSAAAEMYLALARAYPAMHFVQLTGSACKPFRAAYQDARHRCVKLLDRALQLAEHNKLDAVVVASSWRDDFRLALPDLLRLQGKGTPLLLVGPPLLFSEEVAKAILRMQDGASLSGTVQAMVDTSNFPEAHAMPAFAHEHGFAYLDRVQLYCAGACPLVSPMGEPMVLDKFHLSLPGIDLLGQRMKSGKVLESLWQATSGR